MDIKVLASGSKGNCYMVDNGKTPLLLECGIKFKDIQRGLNFQVAKLAGCLISHEHGDHSKAAGDLMRAGIRCYMSQGTQEMLKLSGHYVKTIEAGRKFFVGSWAVLPFGVQHDAREPLGFLLANQTGEKLLYATDTYYLRFRFQGLTHIMLEVNYSADILRENVSSGALPPVMQNRIVRSHMGLETALEMLRANDLSSVREIHLLHLSDGNADAERFKREIQELTGKPVYIA